MKFKYLIIAFSIILVLILLTLALLPMFIAGPESAASLRYITLPLLLSMSTILVCLGIYFLLNYRLFSLLEREDWPALAYYLEQKIFVKNRYSVSKVRLLASSYMVISDYASVLKLENKTLHAKPAVVEKNALVFGSARILGGKNEDAAAFFKTHLDKGRIKGKEREWIRLFYGFSNLLGGAFSKAEPEFLTLAVSSRDALITGLSAYFLEKNLVKNSLKPEDCRSASKNGRSRVLETLKNAGNWDNEVKKMAAEIHVTIIRKYVDEAGKWIFDNISQEAKGADK
ncbi:MAG: hypothetical protein LBQ82_04500 [Treponema sp.]|nr:hypothetical protein [Treponema sp.]